MTNDEIPNDERTPKTMKEEHFVFVRRSVFGHFDIQRSVVIGYFDIRHSLTVGTTGVEPALPKELEPKSSASANSATSP